jgi:hypothetical protein
MDNFIPVIGSISSQLGELTTTVIQEISNPSKISLKKLVEAAETDPIASACIQLKAARVMQLMRSPYTHKDKKITDYVNYNLENMNGSIPDLGLRLSSAMPFGFSTAEFNLKITQNKWNLHNFHILDPRQTYFKAKFGNVCGVKYYDGGLSKNLPLWKVLTISNGLITGFGRKYIYGNPEMLRAYPYIRLKQLIFSEMSIAAKRLATGIVIGKADSNQLVQVLDANGQPIKDNRGQAKTISTVKHLEQQLKKIETNGYIITDKLNDVAAMQIPAGEQFWNLANTMLNEQIMRCFLVPDTIWAQGVASFGTGGLSTNQLNIMDSTINAIVEQVADQLIEKVFKRLIILNYGVQDTYGKFDTVSGANDPNLEGQRISNLINVLGMGLVPNTDTEALNVLRNSLGLPPISTEAMKFQSLLQGQMEQLKQEVPQATAMEQQKENELRQMQMGEEQQRRSMQMQEEQQMRQMQMQQQMQPQEGQENG